MLRRTRLNALLLFIIFVVVSQLLENGLAWLVLAKLKVIDTHDQTWRPSIFIWFESISAFAAIVAAWIVARLQARRLANVGYAASGAPRHLMVGSVYGLLAVVLLIGGIASLGGFTFGTLAMHGTLLATYVLGWLVAMFGIGIAEETTFRAAGLITLGEAVGFWTAAILTTIIFAGLHYFFKPGENLADALSVGLLGLFMCFTVRRTGSIWFAVGFHALFDYAALFLFGAPNSGNHGGQPIPTRLLTGDYHGPVWLTGGHLGIEASWLVFPVIALLFVAFHLTYRKTSTPPIGSL